MKQIKQTSTIKQGNQKEQRNREKPQYNIWQNLAFMIKAAWSVRKAVPFFCIGIALLEVGLNLAQLFVAPAILARVEQRDSLVRLAGVIAVFSFLLFFGNALREYLVSNAGSHLLDVRFFLMRRLFQKAYQASYPQVQDPDCKNRRERALNAVATNLSPTEHIWRTLSSLWKNCLGFLIYLFLLSRLTVFLAAVILITTVAGFLAGRRIHEWGYRHREEEARNSRQFWYLQDKARSISLAKEIRIFGMEDWFSSMCKGVQRLQRDFVARRERVYLGADLLDLALAFARNGIAYWYLIHLTLEQGLPASEFLLYVSAISGFSAWVMGILGDCMELHKESLELSAVQEYLYQEEEFRFQGGDPIPPREKEGWELRLEQVSFRYPGAEDDTIHQLDLTIRPGEKLAIVGLNGAGKTTLIKLLCGFFDPSEGRVLLNGTDIRRFNRQEYYALFSAVFQETSVPEIAMEHIIAQEKRQIDREKLAECVRMAGLSQTVGRLPNGLRTPIGKMIYEDGMLLSGGQMQRLLLARALYKDGAVLVLDEPTAALDPLAECDIYQKYEEMTRGKTSIFISHRLASTRFCDRIIFLENGTVLEEGTHEALRKQGGAYARLFDIQSQYYQEESSVSV